MTNNIAILIFCLACIIYMLVNIIWYMFKELRETKEIIESKQASEMFILERDKFYNSIDIDRINKDIDKYIKDSIDLYMFESGRSGQGALLYLSDDDIRDIIKNVTYQVINNMSDMYVSFISLLYNVKYDDNGEFSLETISYIRNRVKDQVILMVSNINNRNE